MVVALTILRQIKMAKTADLEAALDVRLHPHTLQEHRATVHLEKEETEAKQLQQVHRDLAEVVALGRLAAMQA